MSAGVTIGVEEEYQIVDAESRELKPRAGRVLPRAKREVGDEVTARAAGVLSSSGTSRT